VAFRVLVREDGAHRLEDRLADEVLRGDQLEPARLALGLVRDRLVDVGIGFLEAAHVVPPPRSSRRNCSALGIGTAPMRSSLPCCSSANASVMPARESQRSRAKTGEDRYRLRTSSSVFPRGRSRKYRTPPSSLKRSST